MVAEHGIDTPTYSMSKKLIYKDQFLHTATIELASAISNAAKLDYKTTQQHAIDQFIHEVRQHTSNTPAYVPEWPDALLRSRTFQFRMEYLDHDDGIIVMRMHDGNDNKVFMIKEPTSPWAGYIASVDEETASETMLRSQSPHRR